MRLALNLGVGGVLVLAGAHASGPTTTWVMEAEAGGFKYSSPDVGDFTIDGVCEMKPSSASCWRPDGTPDPAITQRVESHLSLPDYQQLGFAYRRKNIFVVWHGPTVGNTFATIYFGGQPRRPGPGLFQAWTVQQGKGYEFVGWLPAREDQTSCDILLSIPVPLPVVRPSLRSGQFRVGDFRVAYGRLGPPKLLQPVDYGVSQIGGGGPWTSQEYKISPDPRDAGLWLTATFLGSDGKPRPAYWSTGPPRGGTPVRQWVGAGTNSSGPGPTGYWAFSGDPSRISAIEVHPAYTRWVTFRDVALRPKP